jgi:transposase InsO family protein
MSNNGSAYRSRRFADAVATTGLRHIRPRPYMPRTNGKAERFILSSLSFPLLCRAGAAMLPWSNQYNHSRPHSSSAVVHPISRIARDSLLGHDS